MSIRDEISIHDNNKLGNEGDESDSTVEDEGPSDQLFYDASDEFEEYDMLDLIPTQLKKWGMGPYVIHDLSARGDT